MEKRLVLSFVLSFLVLYIWASVTPKAQKESVPLEKSETIDNKEFSMDSSSSSNLENHSTPTLLKPTSDQIQEKNYTLDSENFILIFSSLGAKVENVFLKEYNVSLPLNNIATIDLYNNISFDVVEQSENSIEFFYSSDNINIKKIFKITNGFTFNLEIQVKNKTLAQENTPIDFKCFTLNMNKLDNNEKMSKGGDDSLYEYVLNLNSGIKRKNKAHKFSMKDNVKNSEAVQWIGFRDRYYCAICKPHFNSQGYSVKMIDEKNLDITITSENAQLSSEDMINYSAMYYIGPEKTDILSKYDFGFQDIKRYYKFGLFDKIAKLIDWIMKLLFKFIPNWGTSIILISIIIYYSMYPLTARGMASMKKMQSLQPKIQVLKEKYEKNPQKLNQEMLDLYRKEKINPLGGCFPILLQMPVFVGLYQVLWRNVDFKGAKFLWIKDLSQPDRLFYLPFDLPVIGNEINLLPILMIFIMFFQQKFSSKNMVLTDPMQIQQQKMMATIMPLLLGFIFYKFASGLTLYFTMFYIFSTLTQWKLSKETTVKK
ncbi:MAG: YidC/Oxa1 family insertase periplasmic-domain containing protein [Candidatus Omnitrophota bacterium]